MRDNHKDDDKTNTRNLERIEGMCVFVCAMSSTTGNAAMAMTMTQTTINRAVYGSDVLKCFICRGKIVNLDCITDVRTHIKTRNLHAHARTVFNRTGTGISH